MTAPHAPTDVAPAHRFRKRPGVVSRTFDGMVVLVVVDRRMTHELNAVGSRVWDLLEGRTVGEVADAVAREFDVDPDRASRDVIRFMHHLRDVGAVEDEQPPASSP